MFRKGLHPLKWDAYDWYNRHVGIVVASKWGDFSRLRSSVTSVTSTVSSTTAHTSQRTQYVPITKSYNGEIQDIHKTMVRFQKLTRNLFLILHGHNVHRQQRQLSKFLMRYQQFASHAYCGAAGPVSKMASQQEKAFCVLRLEVSDSVITVQREFSARFRKDARMRNLDSCRCCRCTLCLC